MICMWEGCGDAVSEHFGFGGKEFSLCGMHAEQGAWALHNAMSWRRSTDAELAALEEEQDTPESVEIREWLEREMPAIRDEVNRRVYGDELMDHLHRMAAQYWEERGAS